MPKLTPLSTVFLAAVLSSCSTNSDDTTSGLSSPSHPATWEEVTGAGLVLTRVDSLLYERLSFHADGTVTPVLGAGVGRYTATPLSWRITNHKLQLWSRGRLYGEYRILGLRSGYITAIDETGRMSRFRISHS